MKVLLAGAGGQVGRRVHRLLAENGHEVHSIRAREVDLTRPGSAKGLGRGQDVLVSCAGASVSFRAPDRRPYSMVDPAIHQELIEECRRAGIRRFVYLGVHTEPAYLQCEYVQAHEKVCAMLKDADLDFTVVRPTGIYSAFAELLPFARYGVLPLLGDGSAKTNPIDPEDVAEIVVANLLEGERDLPCGGPEILSRRQINEILAQAAGKPHAWMPSLPIPVVRAEAALVGLGHPRLAELLRFFAMVSTTDAIAPRLGRRQMNEFICKYWAN